MKPAGWLWPKEPPDADMIRACELSGGLCLLPEHPGRCITAADTAANPKLQGAKPCVDCGCYRGHEPGCDLSDGAQQSRAEDTDEERRADRGWDSREDGPER